MDVLSLLRHEHETLTDLFSQYDRAGQDVQARAEACRALRDRLRQHSHIEEEVLYAAVLKVRARDARAVVREALAENQALDGLLAELDELEPDHPEHGRKVDALRERVERHTSAAEGRIFQQARIHLTDARLETLGRQAESLQGVLTSLQ
jgi:iron-sulfur cluster repair protein YtfE (RIC family)